MSSTAPREDAPGDVIDGRFRLERHEPGLGAVHAVDIASGDAVLVHLPPGGFNHKVCGNGFVYRTWTEVAARTVSSLSHPAIARIRAFAPRVVIDSPRPIEQVPGDLTAADLAMCALLVLDVVARLHAAGLTGVSVEERNLRLRKVDGHWTLALIYPPLPNEKYFFLYSRRAPEVLTAARRDEVLQDVASVGALLFRLYESPDVVARHVLSNPWSDCERVPLPNPSLDAIASSLLQPPRAPATAALATQDAVPDRVESAPPSLLDEVLKDSIEAWTPRPRPADFPRSARDLAEALVEFAPPDRRWRDLVEAMPRVTRVTPVRDWDLLIERGEIACVEERARLMRIAQEWRSDRAAEVDDFAAALDSAAVNTEDHRLPPNHYIAYPLAAAYHARACVALQRGDRARARADLDRAIAIDPAVPHLVTRGYLRAIDRDWGGALNDYDAAIRRGSETNEYPVAKWGMEPSGDPLHLARAYYCRGCLLIEQGRAQDALVDLEGALACIEGYERLWAVSLPESPASSLAPSRAWIGRAREAALRRLESTFGDQ